MKCEVSVHGQQVAGHQRRSCLRLAFFWRQRAEDDLEGGGGALDIQCLQRGWVQLPKVGKRDLGAKPQRARAARVEPARRVLGDRRARQVKAKCCHNGHNVGFDVEYTCDVRGVVPMASMALQCHPSDAYAGCQQQLLARLNAGIGLPNLKQSDIGETAVAIALGGGEQSWQQARAHRGQLARNRVGELQCVLATAEQLGLAPWNERPGHGLDQSARGENAARSARTPLALGQYRAGHACLARHRGGGDVVEADNADDFLDEVGRAVNVRPPARHRGTNRWGLGFSPTRRCPAGIFQLESERGQNAANLLVRDLDAGKLLDAGELEQDRLPLVGWGASDNGLGWLTAAQFQDHVRCHVEAGHDESRVDATLEAVAGIRNDAGSPASGSRAQRIEVGAFDEDIGGLPGAAGGLAAHDATEAEGALLVGDDAHVRLDLVRLAVERGETLASLAKPRADGACQLVGIVDVQWPATIDRDEIGDVDQSADRAQTDCAQALLQPVGRWTVADAADVAAGKYRAGVGGIGRELEEDIDRAFVVALDRAELGLRLELAETCRRQIAGYAAYAGAIGTVGRQLDLDDRVVEAHDVDVAFADLACVRIAQIDYPVMVVGQLHLALGAQHAVGIDAADRPFLERDTGAGNIGADGGKHADHASAAIGSAAYHLDRGLAGGNLNLGDLQLVCVRVLLGVQHPRDGEGRQLPGGVLDAFDLEADRRQPGCQLIERSGGIEVVAQPGESEFHGGAGGRELDVGNRA